MQVEKGVRCIKLFDLPIFIRCNGDKNSNYWKFCYKLECFIKSLFHILAGNLGNLGLLYGRYNEI